MKDTNAIADLLFVKDEQGLANKKVTSDIRIDGEKYTLSNIKTVSLEDEKAIRALIKRAKSKGYKGIYFLNFGPFNNQIEKLEQLAQSGLIFSFDDLNAYTNQNIGNIIDFLKYNRQVKGKRIKQGIKKSKKEKGDSFMDHVKSKGVASRSRTLKALTNPTNQNLIKTIRKLRLDEDMSFGSIADYLNEHEMLTVKGSRHYASGVQNLYLRSKELEQAFAKEKLLRNDHVVVPENPKQAPEKNDYKVSGIEFERNYEDFIDFTIDIDVPFEVLIRDYEKELVLKLKFGLGETQVKIDLDEHYLLPGIHYLIIRPKDGSEYPIKEFSIYLRQGINESIK